MSNALRMTTWSMKEGMRPSSQRKYGNLHRRRRKRTAGGRNQSTRIISIGRNQSTRIISIAAGFGPSEKAGERTR